MKKQDFLHKLIIQKKISIVERSRNICNSYLRKSENCQKSAKILLKNNLYETSISLSYYAMYNSLIALFFNTGIKCKNHLGSILLLRIVYGEEELSRILNNSKKKRINTQYYIDDGNEESLKEIAISLLHDSQVFIIKIKSLIDSISQEDSSRIINTIKELNDRKRV